MTINLRFINQSQAAAGTVIAITCAEPRAGTPAVAWRIIRNIGTGSIYPFTYSSALELAAGDSDGNYTPKKPAEPGSAFSMQHTSAGNQLVYEGKTLHPDTIEVKNLLPSGKVTAFVFRDSNVCAQSQAMPPNTRTNFSLTPPLLYIGRAAGVQEGDISNTATFADTPVRINLQGVQSADIVMKGGGGTPLVFSVENINKPQ